MTAWNSTESPTSLCHTQWQLILEAFTISTTIKVWIQMKFCTLCFALINSLVWIQMKICMLFFVLINSVLLNLLHVQTTGWRLLWFISTKDGSICWQEIVQDPLRSPCHTCCHIQTFGDSPPEEEKKSDFRLLAHNCFHSWTQIMK